MGASNVMAAYALYAGRVPATSMQLLAYMAVVSKDEDRHPWYGQGHRALAQFALGREPDRAGVKAVERAIQPLAEAGAITTDRKAAVRSDGPHTARYRLHLQAPAETTHAPRNVGDVDPSADVSRPPETVGRGPSEDPPRPPKTVHHVPRKPGSRPPKTGLTSPENRGTEEPGGTTRSEIEEEDLCVRTDLTVARAREAEQDPISPPVDEAPSLRVINGSPDPKPVDLGSLFPAAVPDGPPTPPAPSRLPPSPFRRGDAAAEAIAQAQANRAARIAAHQAALAAGEATS